MTAAAAEELDEMDELEDEDEVEVEVGEFGCCG